MRIIEQRSADNLARFRREAPEIYDRFMEMLSRIRDSATRDAIFSGGEALRIEAKTFAELHETIRSIAEVEKVDVAIRPPWA